jgi:hypothetical protein
MATKASLLPLQEVEAECLARRQLLPVQVRRVDQRDALATGALVAEPARHRGAVERRLLVGVTVCEINKLFILYIYFFYILFYLYM